MYTTVSYQKFSILYISKHVKLFFAAIVLLVLVFLYVNLYFLKPEQQETLAIIKKPKINDIYFLDFRLLSDKLSPNEKYRIAKVVDITGDIITLVYGGYFYQHQHAATNSIKYGQLSFKQYFETKRYNIPFKTIQKMYENHAIYLAKRPVRNKLYGNSVGLIADSIQGNYLTYGFKENAKGESFLADQYNENHYKFAFEYFTASANLGYVKGAVNLAEMYINGQYVDKNLQRALYWLKQASLQSYKPAILKYVIVCKQLSTCHVVDFYQDLLDAGVNIKIRSLDFELTKLS